MKAARINGYAMHCSDDGEGTPILLVNSLGTDLRVWDRLIDNLPDDLRFIRYDKRGHGLSEGPEGDYGMGELVSDAAALLDHLGIEEVVVVGLSIGGMIAQGLAAERPGLVKAAVLMDTAAKIGTPDMWDQRIAGVRSGGVASLADAILERWFTKAFRARRTDELALWRNMLTRTPVAGYAGCCAAIRDCDLMESTSRLRLPVLAIAGDEDGSTPPDLVRETADLIPGAQFEIVRGAGHLPCVERPDDTAALILGFLQENRLD